MGKSRKSRGKQLILNQITKGKEMKSSNVVHGMMHGKQTAAYDSNLKSHVSKGANISLAGSKYFVFKAVQPDAVINGGRMVAPANPNRPLVGAKGTPRGKKKKRARTQSLKGSPANTVAVKATVETAIIGSCGV